MYSTVHTTGNGSVVYINPNCNMKLIYEYLRIVSEVPDSKEIDLCSENGRLLGIYESTCSAKGLIYLKPKAHYFLVTFDYNESTGELFNPLPLMHHTNRDFDSVFTTIKRHFGILPNEPIDDFDAALIFEHWLSAYQEKTLEVPSSGCKISSPASAKRSSEKKKRTHSVISLTSRRKVEPVSILKLWREEKQAQLAKASASEPLFGYRSSQLETSEEEQGDRRSVQAEEIIPEDPVTDLPTEKKTINFQKRTSQTAAGKKGSKKHPKKTGKIAKEDAQLQKAAPISQISLTPKPSHIRMFPPSHQMSLDAASLRTLWASKSSLQATPGIQEPNEQSLRRPCDSIRKFFKNYPIDMIGFPKPPVIDSDSSIPGGHKEMKKSKKLTVGSKNRKIIASRPMKIRK